MSDTLEKQKQNTDITDLFKRPLEGDVILCLNRRSSNIWIHECTH